MSKFQLVLGEENTILPGKLWTEYDVDILDDKMICVCAEDPSINIEIPYASLKKACFELGQWKLWLQCKFNNGDLLFSTPRKSWKSEAAEKLINEINSACGICDMKTYKRFTGPFGVFSTF